MSDEIETRYREAASRPKNLGEMENADAVGTAGSPGCGDMLRIWLKFREEKEKGRVIDQASFQSFGCETALAVASVATEMLAGKTMEEARAMKGADLSASLGPLPPMKIHCAGLVEEALQQALEGGGDPVSGPAPSPEGLSRSIADSQSGTKKVIFEDPSS